MKVRAVALVGVFFAASALFAVNLDGMHTGTPTLCPTGSSALGARCCGKGQLLHLDSRGVPKCTGRPTQCPGELAIGALGCEPPERRVHYEGGTLKTDTADWESPQSEPGERKVNPFDLDAFEVSESRYQRCVSDGACAPIALPSEPGLPVTTITHEEAGDFCKWTGGMLPTSDQFAFAMSTGRERRYAWGDTGAVCRRASWGLERGPCAEGGRGPNVTGVHPEGRSPEGAFDLSGNVAEWTAALDSQGFADVRGGSWKDNAASQLRSWASKKILASTRSSAIGFRCAYISTH